MIWAWTWIIWRGAASGASISIPRLEETDHPSDAPTMVAGLDERSRRMMAEAESRARDKDLTELERELEASFVADLGQRPRGDQDRGARARIGAHGADAARHDSRSLRDLALQVARVFRRSGTGALRRRFDLAAARHQRRQHRPGSRSARECLGGRYRRTAARRRRSLLHRGVRGQPAQPQGRSRRRRGAQRSEAAAPTSSRRSAPAHQPRSRRRNSRCRNWSR